MAITTETRDEIIGLVVGMVNAAPGASILAELADIVDAGLSVHDLAIAIANNPAFKVLYPSFLTNTEFATNFLTQLFGGETDLTTLQGSIDVMVADLNSGTHRGAAMYTAITALAAADTADADFGAAATAFDNKVDVASHYSVTLLLSAPTLDELVAVVENVTSDATTVVAAKAVSSGTSTQGSTFSLTTGVDTISGTKGDDTILATNTTLTGLDSIDGGAGVDTLVISDVAGAAADIAIATKIAGVEKITLASVSGLKAGAINLTKATSLTDATITLLAGAATEAVTASATTDLTISNSSTGVTALTVTGGHNINITNGKVGASDVTVNGNATSGIAGSVSVTGGHVITIDDTTKDVLTTASVNGNTGAATISSDNLTSLGLTANAFDATVVAKAGTRDLTITTNAATAGTVTDATATGVTVNAVTKASAGLTLTAGAAKAVNLNATGAKLTLADVNIGAATTLNTSGDSAITVTATTGVGALTTIAATGTGGLNVGAALGTGVTVTGSDGSDSFAIAAHTKSVALGAGDDKVTMTAALGTGGTVTGGDGTDTVVVNAASFALTGVSGFETLGLGAAATGAYSAAGFTGLTQGAVAAAVSYTNVAAGSNLTVTAAPGFATTYTLKDATGASDALGLTITNAAAVNANTITASGIETVNITSDELSSKAATGINHTLTLVDADATGITVAGDAGLVLTFAGTKLATFDASGTTTATSTVSLTTAALTVASTLTGGAGIDTLNAAASTKAVTLHGNGGVDTLTGSATVGSTINGGAGNDVIVGGTGADTIDGGDGNDTITSSTGLDMLTGGAGMDTFNIAVPTNGNSYAEIKDFVLGATGDNIVFASAAGAPTFATAAITLAGTAVFQDFLDAAAAGDGSTNTAVSWFQFGGDTYVVADSSAGAVYANGVDSVVKLTGAITLTTATIADFT